MLSILKHISRVLLRTSLLLKYCDFYHRQLIAGSDIHVHSHAFITLDHDSQVMFTLAAVYNATKLEACH